ncbi:hypothetical protein DPMN_093864 [Dreissena polymorpha]|uniref:Rab3GAP regulatory subunit C-terminal domain-containing protein n=1 Tax=Dreissena polymorpha TaxID=45954 RepID=A0A9D4R1E5_DREPO|nr:hypothetical protein DPMN_093864 [Dreissena polymorpha]
MQVFTHYMSMQVFTHYMLMQVFTHYMAMQLFTHYMPMQVFTHYMSMQVFTYICLAGAHSLYVLQVLVTVNDRQSLGAQLLTICGQRVAYKLAGMDAQMMVDLMSNVNPALSTWLKAMVCRYKPCLIHLAQSYGM